METLNYIIYSTESSSDEWVILVHGAGGSLQTWRKQIKLLQDQYKVLALDLRDHGGSRLDSGGVVSYTFEHICADIFKIMTKEGIDRAHFITMSMGSLILQYILVNYPDKIRTAIVAGGIYSIHIPLRIFIVVAKFLTHFIPYSWLYRIFSWLLMPLKNHQSARRLYIRESAKLSQRAYNRWLGLYEQFYSVVRTFSIEIRPVPLLIVSGEQDFFFYSAAKRYALKNPYAHWSPIPGCGHICHLEASEIFNVSILNFLNTYRSVSHNFD